jgi:hypothetical protein
MSAIGGRADGEPVSVNFPDNRENTGKFPGFSREGEKTVGFPIIRQLLTPKFPTHKNREFSERTDGILSFAACSGTFPDLKGRSSR